MKQAARQVSQQTTVVAPTKGLNALGPVSSMDPSDALVLNNWICTPYGCQARRGSLVWATGMNGQVSSLLPYHGAGGNNFFAAAGGKIYNITLPGTVGAPVLTGASNNWWQHINISNAGGHFLLAANGADDWFKWDGVAATRVTATEITGVDPRTIIQFELHQRRLWMMQKGSMLAWYLAPDATQGAATSFDLGPIFRRGGVLAQIVSWTLDDGDGADDHLAFISTQGECAVYRGLDPNDAATWGLVGVYFLGAPPVGHRFAIKFSGDVAVVTEYGLVLLSEGLMSTKVNPGEGGGINSKRIQALISNAMYQTKNEMGWQPIVYPDQNLFLLNAPEFGPAAPGPTQYDRGGAVPLVTSGQVVSADQFVYSTLTQGWSTFTGWQAGCFALWNRDLYYGANGEVCLALVGYKDAVPFSGTGSGTAYYCEAMPAFNYFGQPGSNKHLKMFRLNIISEGAPQISVGTRVAFDFTPLNPPSTTPQPDIVSIWDQSLWDQNYWSGTLNTLKKWITANGISFAGTIRLSVVPDADTFWVATDWVYEMGGVW